MPASSYQAGTLFVVATPIGNLEDITLRAIDVLGQVELVACEDTRRTGKLLGRYDIKVPMMSYHDHNEQRAARTIVDALEQGRSVALVSDAGTPGISDPGYRLLSLVAERGLKVVPVPGPSAVTAALSVAALPATRFTFMGFLARRGAKRRQQLEEIALMEGAVILFEAPTRVGQTLGDLSDSCGPDRRVVLLREGTKLNEELLRGTLGQLAHQLGPLRGEVTLVVEGTPAGDDGQQIGAGLPLAEEVELLHSRGMERSEAIRRVARGHQVPRSSVYRAVLERRQELDDSSTKE